MRLICLLATCTLEKVRERGEEAHDLGFIQDIREDSEVIAELGKRIKVHHAFWV